MFRWFRTFCRQIFLSDLRSADATFVQMANQIKTLRGQLNVVYEEVELAIRALDVLGERVDDARRRIKDRVGTPRLEPQEFSGDHRQRT